MVGLHIKELLLRGDLCRCLIVAPGGLVAQWRDELPDRFGLRFAIAVWEMIRRCTECGERFAGMRMRRPAAVLAGGVRIRSTSRATKHWPMERRASAEGADTAPTSEDRTRQAIDAVLGAASEGSEGTRP